VVHRPAPVAAGRLRPTGRDVPEPGPGELLVRSRAGGVGRTGLWPKVTCRRVRPDGRANGGRVSAIMG